ncbi:hypothetical protein EYV94_06485 [Puteibacter caeruleilacunae]|nr:hypothetical protein EYV94_06485 [Puteibacter caeruleilacunae]
MGKYVDGPFGKVSGQIGNLIASSWMDINYFKIKSDHYHDANTLEQQGYRKRFGNVSSLATKLKDLCVDSTYKPFVKKKKIAMTGRNYFMSVNAQVYDLNGTIGDYSLLKTVVGALPLPFDLKVENDSDQAGAVRIIWRSWCQDNPKRANDHLDVIVVKEMENGDDEFVIVETEFEREELSASVKLPFEKGTLLHLYVFFASPDNQEFTNDVYAKIVMN